jgi:hypothetical protein
MAKSHLLFTLRVTIRDINPPIWRRIQVEGSTSLRKLHHILQAAFGWSSSHLHEYEIDYNRYARFDDDDVLDSMDPDATFDDRKTKLIKVAIPGVKFVYEYDFGDGWKHDVAIEDLQHIEGDPGGYAVVLDGERACPPEDVGGPWGYDNMLKTLRDAPESEEGQSYRTWIGAGYDSERFDRHAANAALLRMAWNRWGGK